MAVPKWMDPVLKSKKGQKKTKAASNAVLSEKKKQNALRDKIKLLWDSEYVLKNKDERFEPAKNPLDAFIEEIDCDPDIRPLIMEDAYPKREDKTAINTAMAAIEQDPRDILDRTGDAISNPSQSHAEPVQQTEVDVPKLDVRAAYLDILEKLNALIQHYLVLQDFNQVALLTNLAQGTKTALEPFKHQVPKRFEQDAAKRKAKQAGLIPKENVDVKPFSNNLGINWVNSPVVKHDNSIDGFLDRLEQAGFKLVDQKPVKTNAKTKKVVTKKAKTKS